MQYPAAPNHSVARSHIQKYREAKRLALEHAKRRQELIAKLSNMSKDEIKKEVDGFIDSWLKDMQLDNNTSSYWASAADSSTFYSVRSWKILGVRGQNEYSTTANTVIVNIQSSTKGGFAISQSWKIGIQRDDNMSWKILYVTDKD